MKIAIIGAGGWGTALAIVLAQNGHDIVIWARNAEVADEINRQRTNKTYLPDVAIPDSIRASVSPEPVNSADVVVVAVPTQHIREIFTRNHFAIQDKIVVSVSKGIERGTLARVSEILVESAHIDIEKFVALTGPSHAEEVSRFVPTTVVAASVNAEVAHQIQKIFSTPRFRVYTSHDLIGAELGGALKNVIAISAGIIDGLKSLDETKFGDNTKAALLTRGIAEISRLGAVMGADPLTLSGLSGLGDLFVTCFSKHSRNRYVGEEIGKGKTLTQVLSETKKVAEGVWTTDSAHELAKRYGVEMPIIEQVYSILFENKDPKQATHELMIRESKPEYWW